MLLYLLAYFVHLLIFYPSPLPNPAKQTGKDKRAGSLLRLMSMAMLRAAKGTRTLDLLVANLEGTSLPLKSLHQKLTKLLMKLS
jgi:hypothetical protein